MTTNYHTPYEDDTTKFRASHMNSPLSELDTQITANVAAIDALPIDFEDCGDTPTFSGNAGKFLVVNSIETALILVDIVTYEGDVVVDDGNVVVN